MIPQAGQSRSIALIELNRKTRMRKGRARVRTSSLALYESMKWGTPRSTNQCSVSRRGSDWVFTCVIIAGAPRPLLSIPKGLSDVMKLPTLFGTC